MSKVLNADQHSQSKSQMSHSSMHSKDSEGSLPQISAAEGEESKQDANPFTVPTDFEIFKLKEQEKQKRQQMRLMNAQQKIWEKGVKDVNAGGRVQMLAHLGSEIEDDTRMQEQQKINIVEAAKSAIKNRVKQKEPMYKFIQKKREMFLFQMLIDQKREQINQFEELSRVHERGLQKSEQLLEDDLETFNKFLEENKNKSRTAIKKAEDETKRKQEKIQQIKQLNEKKADLLTKNAQKLEQLEDLWGYKQFLDKITPKEFFEEQQKESLQKVVEKGKQLNQQQGSNNQKGPGQFDNYSNTLDKNLLKMLEDEVDESEQMYFSDPDSLEKIFETLEEKNLFLISNTKEREQKYEEAKHKFEDNKKKLNSRKQLLDKQKKELQKQIEQINSDVASLKSVQNKNDTEVKGMLKRLEDEIRSEYIQVTVSSQKDGGGSKQIGKAGASSTGNGVDMLGNLEWMLDKCIIQLKKYSQDPDFSTQQKDELKNQQNKEIQAQHEQWKKPQACKRIGRPIMKRTILKEKVKIEEEKEEKSEDEDEKYFR